MRAARLAQEHKLRLAALVGQARNPFCKACGQMRARLDLSLVCGGCIEWAARTKVLLARRAFRLVSR